MMRIDEIKFKNFRKYVDTSIKFPKYDNDIHLVVAENGVGKTTFLNAITWCLYNEEPKNDENKNKSLPILNTRIIDSSDNKFETASIELKVSDDNTEFIFIRENTYEIYDFQSEYYKKCNHREKYKEQNFKIIIKEKNEEAIVIHDSEECEYYVSSFIPEAIKEFFFFDGEKLDNYFLNNENVKNQTETLSYIELLNIIIAHLKSLLHDYNKKSINSLDSKKLYEEYESLKEKKENNKIDLKEKEKNYNEFDSELKELNHKLLDIPSIKDLKKKFIISEQNKNKYDNRLNDEKNKFNDFIIKESPNIFAQKAIEKTLKIINKNKKENDIIIPEDLFNSSIHNKECLLCNQKLDENIISKIQEKIIKMYNIPEEMRKLSSYESILKNTLNKNQKYIEEDNRYDNSISDLEELLEKEEKEYRNMKKMIDENINNEELTNRRDYLEKILKEKEEDIINCKVNLNELEKRCVSKYSEFEKNRNIEIKNKKYETKITILKKSIDIVEKTRKDIMSETKDEIEKATNDNFFKLIRKNKSFNEVKINDNYEVDLIADNRSGLATASAAETEILALSFALAVHSITEYNAPLVIDTPLARTSGVHRDNIANACLKISKNRQIILILTNEECYGVKTFEEEKISPFKLVESDDEKQIIVERY